MKEKITEKTISSELIYNGKIINLKRDYSEIMTGDKKLREVVEHPGGVVVAAITDNNEILLVRQYRYPVKDELIELPAGKLEPGESPDDSIKRELIEECGYTADNWKKITCVYSSPGFCNEKLHFYKATKLTKVTRIEEEGEIIDHMLVPLEKVWQMIEQGKIVDMKSIALLGLIK